MKRMTTGWLVGALALALTGMIAQADPVTPEADIVMDATVDDGDNPWENTAADPANAEGLLDLTGGVERVAVSSTLGGITAAFDFPGGSGVGGDVGGGQRGALFVNRGTTSTTGFSGLGWQNSPVSIEIWFKPAEEATYPSNGHILFETGGGTGLGIFYNDGLLQVGRNSSQVISHDISDLDDDFIQAVLTFNSTSGGDMVLYINGEQAATGTTGTGSWCGGDAAALATRGGNNTGGRGNGDQNTRSFHGKMAIFRAYRNTVLTAEQVAAIYEIVADQLFSNLTATEVTTSSALLGAALSTDVSAATLVWDTADKGTEDTDDWSGILSLGALMEGPVSGTATGLAADTFYTFRFYGEHGVETEWSMPRTFATALTAAQTPVFTDVETSFQSVTLQWTDNANTETGYVLRRANSPSGPFDVIAELGPNATSYLDAGLLGDTTYHYQLAAVNEVNGSSTAFEDCVTQATTTARPTGKLMYSSPVPPSVVGEDIASFGTSAGTDKWWHDTTAAGRTIGQTFTTPGTPVLFNAFTFQVGGGAEVHPTKTYVLRLGTVSDTTFTEFHSETFTQDFVTYHNEYWTYQVETPVELEPDTLYGVDVGMTSSTSAWQTGIPYPHRTANVYPGGTRFRSGVSGVGTETMVDVSGDRIFHINLLQPPPAGTMIMIR